MLSLCATLCALQVFEGEFSVVNDKLVLVDVLLGLYGYSLLDEVSTLPYTLYLASWSTCSTTLVKGRATNPLVPCSCPLLSRLCVLLFLLHMCIHE